MLRPYRGTSPNTTSKHLFSRVFPVVFGGLRSVPVGQKGGRLRIVSLIPSLKCIEQVAIAIGDLFEQLRNLQVHTLNL